MVPKPRLVAEGVASPPMAHVRESEREHAGSARTMGSAAAVLVGAGVYAVLQGGGVVRFAATPLILGVIAIVAGLVGIRRRVVATGLVLAAWGTAVLLVDHGVVPAARTTPAYMLGVGVGFIAVALLAPRSERGDWLTSASVVAFTGPLSLYAAYDVAALGRWPLWSVTLVAWAAWEAFWARRDVTSGG